MEDPRIGKVFSHYKILSVLGGGGMGVVYKAEDINLKRTVALKFLALNLMTNEQTKTRFTYEARAASALDHPRIGTIYQIGETEQGEMFIAMAYYEGDTLKDRMLRKKVPVQQAIKFISQIANGLAAAHEQGIVHRDVKPANIIITKDGFVKIVDFGLAKLGDSTRITAEGTSMGTPAYMSPEQAKGREVDHRSDIWALGVILFELLTGELPFQGKDSMSLMFNIVNSPARPLNEVNADLKPGYQKILDKMLAKKKEDRYDNLNEFIGDLNSVDKPAQPAVDDKETVILDPDVKETQILREKKSVPKKAAPPAPRRKSKAKILVPIFIMLLVAAYFGYKMQSAPTGYLEIVSDPSGADIELNGELLTAKTPAMLSLDPGSYKVNVSITGLQSMEREFDLAADTTISHEFTLSLAEETATFIIKSNPAGAAIYVDGENTGKVTPNSVNGVEPGNHDVELRLAGYKNTITTLYAEAGENKGWSPSLQKQMSAPDKPDIKKSTPKPQKPASLLVDSEPPGAIIYLNGRNTGEKTPHRIEKLLPGRHLVQLYRDGYKEWKEQINLSEDEKKTIKRELKEKEKGQVVVQAFDGVGDMKIANIYVDGKPFEQTPKTIELPEGEYVFEAKLFGYDTITKKITVQSGEKETIRFTFER